LAVLVAFCLLLVFPAKPSFFEAENSGQTLLELEGMLTLDREVPRQPAAKADLYPPFYEFFRNDTLFAGFIGALDEDLTPPQINLTYREIFLGGSIPPAWNPAASRSQRSPHLRPILVSERL
jgi:hypothetical protein